MRYVLVSDIHANYSALQVVHNLVKQWRAQDGEEYRYWFLGDILGRGPDPIECLKWMRFQANLDARWLPGNHDEAVLRLGDGAREERAQEHEQRVWHKHWDILQQLEHREYLQWFQNEFGAAIENHARSLAVDWFEEITGVFVHGRVDRLDKHAVGRRTDYYYPWKSDPGRFFLIADLKLLWREFGGVGKTVLLVHGHTHYPVFGELRGDDVRFYPIQYGKPISLSEGCLAINPGSVGQPKDGDPRAAFAVLDTIARTITYHRVMYDLHHTVHKMEQENYPEFLIETLLNANGREQLAFYRTVYRAPDLGRLDVNGIE